MSTIDMHNFSERVAERRIELGWSQAMLAKNASMHPAMLSRILGLNKEELHNRRPRTFQKLADALGVTLVWLISGKEPKFPSTPPQALPDPDLVIVRIRTAVEVWAEYLEQHGYRLPPNMMAESICRLYESAVIAGMHEKDDVRRLLGSSTSLFKE